MWQLQLPRYQFSIKKINNRMVIFDPFRKKMVRLTPEEWVRQNFLQFLILERGFPAPLLSVECQLKVNGLVKRCDALFYSQRSCPHVIVEFKAPNVPITQSVFDQAAVYNHRLNVRYFILSNGLVHYCCRLNHDTARYDFFEGIPSYEDLEAI